MRAQILLFLLALGVFAGAATDDAIVVPTAAADQLPISDGLRKAAKDYGISLKGLVSFRDPRNWWELSTTGPRRGVPLNKEISVLLDYGGKSYWLLEHDSRNDSLLLGPISGNGIKDLALEDALQERLRNPRFYDHMHTLGLLLNSTDVALIRLALGAVPVAMQQDLEMVQTYLHYLRPMLPERREEYVQLGLRKETEAALASMEAFAVRLQKVTVVDPVERYEPGLAPDANVKNRIPESAWSEAVNGLQVTLVGPDQFCFNEALTLQFVFRNASDKPIRLSIPEKSMGLRIAPEGKHNSQQCMQQQHGVGHWELAPGQQVAVPAPCLLVRGTGDIGPPASMDSRAPGTYNISVSTGIVPGKWTRGPQEKSFHVPPADEWRGAIHSSHRLVLIDKALPPVIPVPAEFPADHGIPYARSLPPKDRTWIRVQLPARRTIYLAPDSGAHWMAIPADFSHSIFWGPITTDQLVNFGLLAQIEKTWGQPADTKRFMHGRFEAQIAAPILLAAADTPLAALGVHIAATALEEDGRSTLIVTTLREQRLKLISQGLEKEMRAALNRLTATEPALPPLAEFASINTSAQLPAGFNETLWGSVDEGLCAAAVMPSEIQLNAFVPVRFFLKNVSEQPLYLAVSSVGAFNLPSVTNVKGQPMNLKLPVHYANPGMSKMSQMHYPDGQPSSLTKLALAPGVIYELATPAYLHWELQPPPPPTRDHTSQPIVDSKTRESTTNIYGPASEVTIRWNLRTTSGRQTGRQHPWPTKGSWSGVPQTAAKRVTLKL
jgi:hypothetical protein